jgi:site-specific DNA recombinase
MANECPFAPGDRVVVYLRDSGGTNQEDSIERQLQEIKRYCKLNGLEIARPPYIDEARTGREIQKRESILELMEYMRGGAPERGVIIWNYSRFARNTRHGKYIIAELEYLNYIVHAVTDHIAEGPEKVLFQAFKLYSAEIQSEKTGEDVASGLRRLVEQHHGMPGTPPRGFIRKPITIGTHRNGKPRIVSQWVPDPLLVPLVQRAFEMRAKGEAIPRIMRATGLYKSGNCYTTFFENPIYYGELHYADIVIPNYCEPIVEKEIWDEVQRVGQRRKLPQINIDHPRRVNSPFILSGLIFCQECGSPMSAQSFNGSDYYSCSRRKRRHDCHARRVPRQPIEQEVIRILEDHLLTLENLLTIQNEIHNVWLERTEMDARTRMAIEHRLTAVQRKIRNITSAIAEHGYSASLSKQLAQLETQEQDIKAEIEKLQHAKEPVRYQPNELKDIAAQLKEQLHGDTVRMALRGLIARVIAKRTDDQILGVVYCNQVNGQVPPWGNYPKTLLLDVAVRIRKHKAPLRK